MAGLRYVLLCRHAQVDYSAHDSRRAPLSKEGRVQARSLGDRLAEMLRLDDRIRLVTILRGSHTPVVETQQALSVGLLAGDLSAPEVEECRLLDPEHFAPHAPRPGWWERLSRSGDAVPWPEDRVVDRLQGWMSDQAGDPGAACLIVGHQPMLSWIGGRLLAPRWRPGGGQLPLAREIACIAIEDRRWGSKRRLAWTIEAPGEKEYAAASTDLAAKLKAKIEIARWLAGVLFFGLTVLFGALLDPGEIDELADMNRGARGVLIAAGALLVTALGLFIATLYAYDRLSMPTRFWSEGPPSTRSTWLVRRPPSSDVYVRYQNMIRVWKWLFLPAASFTVVGLGLIGGIALGLEGWAWTGAAAVGVAIVLWYLSFRPRLGSED